MITKTIYGGLEVKSDTIKLSSFLLVAVFLMKGRGVASKAWRYE